jgi:sugar lactone lactonase YvrE
MPNALLRTSLSGATRPLAALLITAAAMMTTWGFPLHAQEPATPVNPADPPKVRLPDPASRNPAPPLPADFTWLNSDIAPLTFDGNLKGHIVVLDFWTYCCINCIHILPDLAYLEHKYADQPVVILGVHSAKFQTERDANNIRQAIQRYRIAHPVLVDRDMAVWESYGSRAWPTFAVIDASGRLVGMTSSEGKRDLLDAVIANLLIEARADGTLTDKPIKPKPTALIELQTGPLAFPGKIIASPDNQRLFIADSNHDRILITDPAGKILQTIGSGKRGFDDGSLDTATFANPQGIVVAGSVLYIADTDNHAIRKVDLTAGSVTTIAGDGARSYDRTGGKKGTAQGLASPWDLALDGDRLFIANAGTHQIWVHNLKSGVSSVFSGSGAENIVDGDPEDAQLAQPSGLAIHDGWLYFADSEVSAVRRARLSDGTVETLIGKGLFVFGHVDGKWADARLQHCLGVSVINDKIAVADTYNNAVRLIDLKKRTIETLKLTGDGANLDEPGGIATIGDQLLVPDTNNHRIVRVDPATGKATVLQITQ